jgi:lysozyme
MSTVKPAAKKGAIASVLVLALATPFVMKWEGLKNTTYIDVVGVPTVCYGQTGAMARIGATYSDAECKAALDAELWEYAQELDKCVLRDVTPYQGAAILELGYNVGTPAVCRSTMVRMINAGEPATRWCQQLNRWVRAQGRVYRGLVNRRVDSYNMCIRTN